MARDRGNVVAVTLVAAIVVASVSVVGAADFTLSTHDGKAFTLSEEAGGTRFTWSEALEFPWFLGGLVTATMAAPILQHIWKGNLERFRGRFSDR